MPNSGISEPRKSHQFCGSSDLSNALFTTNLFPAKRVTQQHAARRLRDGCAVSGTLNRDLSRGFRPNPSRSAFGERREGNRDALSGPASTRPWRKSSGERRLRATRAPGTRAFAANPRVSNPNPDRFDLRTRHAYRSSIHPTRLTVASPSPPPCYPLTAGTRTIYSFPRVSDHLEWGSRP